MIRYLTFNEVIDIHRRLIELFGGVDGIRDIEALKSSIEQPRMTFGGVELYATIVEKAAILGFSIMMNHPFIDGNKRTGHAAMEVFLVMNGYEIDASIDEQEHIILEVAAGNLKKNEFVDWLQNHLVAKS